MNNLRDVAKLETPASDSNGALGRSQQKIERNRECSGPIFATYWYLIHVTNPIRSKPSVGLHIREDRSTNPIHGTGIGQLAKV